MHDYPIECFSALLLINLVKVRLSCSMKNSSRTCTSARTILTQQEEECRARNNKRGSAIAWMHAKGFAYMMIIAYPWMYLT